MWYPNPAAAAAHRDRETRTLYVCIGVSVALHALAMISLPASRPAFRPDQARDLTALFMSLSEPAAPAPAPSRPVARREPEVPTPLPRFEPAPVAAPQAAEPVAAPAPAPAESQAVASVPAQVAAPAKPDTTEILDPSLFDAYRLALINAAKRYKRYPVQAMERGWEGRVEIRLVVDANGAIKSALVKTSSRYQVLDDQALEMVRRAFNALAQVQPAPRGREFTVDVPVIFELQTG
jgi:protein TonB